MAEARRLLDRMVSAGDLRPLAGVGGVYEVIVPYADVGKVGELEVLMETQPCVAASHHTAMVFHGLTDDLPKGIHAVVPTGRGDFGVPPGTSSEDWADLPRAPARFPAEILGRPVRWHRVLPQRFGGVGVYAPEGWALRVTIPERTLLDGLLDPDACGGIGAVLRGWAKSRDLLDVNALVQVVGQLDVGVLRQRVGFVLETLGLTHEALDQWRVGAKRGGSSRLCASAPYATAFSERWSLSLNAPTDFLLRGGP
ncbi:MAG: hypothetical protein HY909_03360 [Deltaproteobacteria bacterium]|nr:hypothetical protein [Deltaproteobacteria bacterium]